MAMRLGFMVVPREEMDMTSKSARAARAFPDGRLSAGVARRGDDSTVATRPRRVLRVARGRGTMRASSGELEAMGEEGDVA
jgi:hypothetical protein